jgi:hypothetical protein
VCVDRGEPRGRQWLTGASGHGYARELPDARRGTPAGQRTGHVGAKDQGELDVRSQGMQFAQRSDRVRRAAAFDLERADAQPRLVRDGQLAHAQPLRRPGVFAGGLVRRRVRRYQRDAVERQLRQRRAREREVPEVRRVEGPAEDAQALGQRRG